MLHVLIYYANVYFSVSVCFFCYYLQSCVCACVCTCAITRVSCQRKGREGPGGVRGDSGEQTEVTQGEDSGDICTVGTDHHGIMTSEVRFY